MKSSNLVVLGASGDLAKKKTYPAIYSLYKNKFLPPSTRIVGYARTKLGKEDFEKRITSYIKLKSEEEQETLSRFLTLCTYVSGSYDQDQDFQRLMSHMNELEKGVEERLRHHIFYMALPPSVFVPVASGLKKNCYSTNGINRLVVEKPFGHDLDSSRELAVALGALFKEEEV